MIKFSEPFLTGKEEEYIHDVFKRNCFYGNGFYTKKCQTMIGNKILSKNVLLTDSCTSALEMSALLLRKWNEEQEVILPSYTFSSTASAFARAGFKIVFAEIDPKTMMIDINDAKSKITDRTAAIVVVHYGGFGANAKLFKKLCDNNSIYLVEDAAQAYGCVEEGRYLGTIGDFGCYSFHETKNLHAGLSGALIINNDKFLSRANYIWERGTNRQEVLKGLVDKYSWVEIGGSFYPTEIQAAFLSAQLECYNENISEREVIFFEYADFFKVCNVVDFYYSKICGNFQTNFHAFWIMFSSSKECDFVRLVLFKNEINAYIGYVPLHSSRVGMGMGYSSSDLKLTQEYSERILRLPMHNGMNKDDAQYISKLVVEGIEEYRG